jgi:hypothetical protein
MATEKQPQTVVMVKLKVGGRVLLYMPYDLANMSISFATLRRKIKFDALAYYEDRYYHVKGEFRVLEVTKEGDLWVDGQNLCRLSEPLQLMYDVGYGKVFQMPKKGVVVRITISTKSLPSGTTHW